MKATLRWLMTSLLALLCIVALVGCGTTKEVIVTKTEYIVVSPPDRFLNPTRIMAPPDPQEYLRLSLPNREDALVNYGNAQTTQLGMCNADKKSLRDWKAEQLKLQSDREKARK